MNNTKIPVGLATKLGAAGAAIAGLIALLAAFANGDHTEETITGIVTSALLVYKIMDGRYNQAVAKEVVSDASGEVDDVDLEPVPEPEFEVKGAPQA
jgi:hypothetical protein